MVADRKAILPAMHAHSSTVRTTWCNLGVQARRRTYSHIALIDVGIEADTHALHNSSRLCSRRHQIHYRDRTTEPRKRHRHLLN